MNLSPRTFLVILAVLPTLLWAQLPNMDNYKPTRSNGPLPADFLLTTEQKYERDKQKIDQAQDKSMQQAEAEFYMQTHYSVDQMRFGGSMLVNDTIGQYVSRVADTLLKNDPELRKQLTFFVMRSPVVNAFTTDQGVIFVTMGLITRLHNEAELAFVLAHEIIHYKRHHVLTGYVEGVKAKEGIGQYEATTFENRYLKRHRYARSQESQADEEGFDLLAASNYDPRAAIAAFDILALADGPSSDTLFVKSFFETSNLVFPSKFYVDTIKAIKPQDEDEDDDLATHPSVYKRRKAIIRRFKKLEDTTGKYFLISETMFWKVQTMARFEEGAEFTNENEYGPAIYSNYAIQRLYPHNRYLEKEMVRALYVSVIEKNRRFDFGDLQSLLEALMSGSMSIDDEKPVGEQGRAMAFVSKADATGWNVAVLKYAWAVHQRYPDDADIFMWCRGLTRDLVVKNEITLKDFEINDSMFIVIGNMAKNDTTIARKIKGDSPTARFQAGIDYLKKDSLDGHHYWEFAFIDEMKDSSFVQMFRWAMHYSDSLELDDSLWDEKTSRQRKNLKAEYREEFRGPQGITKVVAVNPMYIAYDSRQENSDVDVEKSIKGRSMLLQEMRASAAKVGLNLTVLDETGMDTGGINRFNDLMLVTEWFDQRDFYGDNAILPFAQQDMKALADKYGTRYFMWSAYITYTSKRGGNFIRAFGLALAPIAPHIAYRLATPREDVYYIAIIYDVVSGKPVFVQRTEMTNQKATKSRLRLHVYDLLHLISSPKKESN
jgi:beta-barrel assembly-enhancing protease